MKSGRSKARVARAGGAAKTKKLQAKHAQDKLNTPKEAQNVDTPDLSELHKPIDISVSSLFQVTKLFETGSNEVKAILSRECDIVYECRICRSLFRSLANFISHKRIYCTNKFNLEHFGEFRNKYDMIKNRDLHHQPGHEPNTDDSSKKSKILRGQVRMDERKDLTSILSMLEQKHSLKVNGKSSPEKQENMKITQLNENPIVLEPIGSNLNAAYQTVIEDNDFPIMSNELMKNQVIELNSIIDENTGILGPDGLLIDFDQANNKDKGGDENLITLQNLNCSICNARFSTKKTLTFHVKTLHTTHRMCYPCPCCSSTFANTWSVYRHLFKVHRKSNDQVRKLRSQIQERAFRRETTAAEDISKKTTLAKSLSLTNLSMNNNTKDWMENQELDIELQRCGICGKRFERKVALFSHSQNCQKRLAANNHSNSKEKNSDKSSSSSDISTCNRLLVGSNKTTYYSPIINLDKSLVNSDKSSLHSEKSFSSNASDTTDVLTANDGINLPIDGTLTSRIDRRNKSASPELETTIRVEAVETLSKDDWDKLNDKCDYGENSNPELFSSDAAPIIQTPLLTDFMFLPEDEYTPEPAVEKSLTGSKRRKTSLKNLKKNVYLPRENDTGRNSNTVSADDNSGKTKSLRLSSSESSNKIDYTALMDDKISYITNIRKLQCLLCKRKFTSKPNLRRHMAVHVGWNRYRCRSCDFKCFIKSECVAHCNKIHNAQNNRVILEKMIAEIPEEEYASNKDFLNENNAYETDVTEEIKRSDVTVATFDKNKDTAVNDDAIVIKEIAYLNLGNSADNDIKIKPEIINFPDIFKTDNPDVEKSSSFQYNNIKYPHNDMAKNSEENVYDNPNKDTDPPKETIARRQNNLLDSDPELRRMVMEVIFGSTEAENSLEKDENESRKRKFEDEMEEETYNSSQIDNVNKSSSAINEEERPHRPIRNRVKAVDKDFVYTLKEKKSRDFSIKGTCRKSECQTNNHDEGVHSNDSFIQEDFDANKLELIENSCCEGPKITAYK
ncbi:zinc finger protein 800 isoform X2 [Prorops nasuta]|uniref:zinc finger protein 800 isoform X2 n=1 Tax=Prorops nasuta TaxID=863751 RepID=UPI0034CD5901